MTCKWLITMVIVSPLTGVVGPLPSGLFMAYKWGDPITTYIHWEPILQAFLQKTWSFGSTAGWVEGVFFVGRKFPENSRRKTNQRRG